MAAAASSTPIAIVCFIAHHVAPAQHFDLFQQIIGKESVIYAPEGSAAHKILNDRATTDKKVLECARLCIIDVGDPACIELATKLAQTKPVWAYYDNPDDRPEVFTPGTYFETAQKVISAAGRVLFASRRCHDKGLFSDCCRERAWIGYYPLDLAYTIRARRDNDALRTSYRDTLFKDHPVAGKKIMVYLGRADERYLNEDGSLGTVLNALAALPKDEYYVFIKQHPRGATALSADWASCPTCSTEDLFLAVDAVFYAQTSMAPLSALADIPTIQLGKSPLPDCLQASGYPFACDGETLKTVLKMKFPTADPSMCGYESGWPERLHGFIKASK